MQPKFAIDIHADAADLLSLPITFAGAGDNIIIFGIPNQLIRVYKIFLLAGAATNLTFKNGTSAFTGAMPWPSGLGMVLDFDTKPWFTTSFGNDFIINSSAGVQIGGMVNYTQGN